LRRTEFVAGISSSPLPAGDVCVIKKVIHDWDDARDDHPAPLPRGHVAGRTSAPGGGPRTAQHEPHQIKNIDIVTLAVTGGLGWTEAQCAALFEAAGVRLERVVHPKPPIAILEAAARDPGRRRRRSEADTEPEIALIGNSLLGQSVVWIRAMASGTEPLGRLRNSKVTCPRRHGLTRTGNSDYGQSDKEPMSDYLSRPVQTRSLSGLLFCFEADPPRLSQVVALIWRHAGLMAKVKGASQRRLFVARALRDPMSVGAWLRFLREFEQAHGLQAARPQLGEKPVRIYAVHGIPIARRVALLQDHYRLSMSCLPKGLSELLWSRSTLELGSLSGRSGQRYRLSFGAANNYPREGEVCFVLSNAEDGLVLSQLTFLLTNDDSATTLLIGGLQGPRSDAGAKARIVAATRDLSGLRPKMAVFIAVAAFAGALGARGLHAVSNRTHTKNGEAPHQRQRMRSDYDSFWIERGGTPTDLGFWIPLGLEPRTERSSRNQQRAQVVALVETIFDGGGAMPCSGQPSMHSKEESLQESDLCVRQGGMEPGLAHAASSDGLVRRGRSSPGAGWVSPSQA